VGLFQQEQHCLTAKAYCATLGWSAACSIYICTSTEISTFITQGQTSCASSYDMLHLGKTFVHRISISAPRSVKTGLTIDITGVRKPENSHGKLCKPVHVNPFISSHCTLESLCVTTLARTKTHKAISCSEEVLMVPCQQSKPVL